MLTAGERATFIVEHMRLDADGALRRRNGHHAIRPITGERFMVAGRQFETVSVKLFLTTGCPGASPG
jgi:hypothetical protein